ncbi:MAG: amino acid--tRNA ligase-related protein [bacterium]
MSSQLISDDFIGQRQRRIANLDELTKRGITCYPAQSKKDTNHATAHAEYESRKGTTLTLSGRIMKWRTMGKLIFADIVDQTGRMQICVRKDTYPNEESNSHPPAGGQVPTNDLTSIVNDSPAFAKDNNAAVIASDAKGVAWQSRQNQTLTWEELKFIDLGDFIQVTGLLERTQAGEVTVFANEIVLLSKALRPYPNQIEDKDERYRRRYVDMVLHPKVREVMKRKATFWQTIRKTLVERDFTEIFLPVLEHTTGGADAKPFVTHHNTLDEDLYLRISLELYSKRAIGAGFEKVFAIGPVFRNEGMSDEHANEFNHVEWYWAYADYRDQMELTKQVIIETAQAVYGKTKFTTRGHSFDLADTWKEIDYTQILKDTYGIDIFADSDEQIAKVALSHGVELESGAANRQRMIDSLWKLVRKTISGPAFLIHEPAFMSPLAKAKTDNPLLTERFHIILAGTEAANGYSEINDPQYQLQQFRDQQKLRDGGDDEAQMLDIDFIEMLEYGMPPTTGLGFSERLFWFFEDITAREGAMFPILRNEVDALTKKIYPFLEMQNLKGKNQKSEGKQETVSMNIPKMDSVHVPGSNTAHTQVSSSGGIQLTRDQALALIDEHIKNPGLRKHCLAVEAAMGALYNHFTASHPELVEGSNRDVWTLTGLLHDADWEECREMPTQHTLKTLTWLRGIGVEHNELIDAILTHAHHVTSYRQPSSPLEWSLYCCDELTGLIVANALILPSKKLADVTVESVIKKMGSKSFAAAIDREGIKMCEEKLGIKLEEFVSIVLHGMQASADTLGL